MLQNNPAGELELALRIRALVEGQNAIVGLGRSFLDINRSVEQLMLGLMSVSGSIESANNEFAFLTSVALKTGLAIDTLGNNYLKLTASSKETMLEGERIRTLFSQTSDALMKLGSDSVNTTRAMNALAQMMSKGQIYSEELKGQLAEAIPGALNIMSRALGLSVQEMLNLMEQGLLTSDALVLFGNQLKAEFSGGTETARTFNQVINDVINQWTLLMKGIGDTGPWTGLKTVISALGTSMDLLATAAGAGLGVALAKAAIGIRSIVVSSQDSVAALGANVSAHRQHTAAQLESARASVASAQASLAEASAVENAAHARLSAVRGTAAEVLARQQVNIAVAESELRTDMLAMAQARLDIQQKKLVASTTLWSQVTNLAFGPVGIIATAIITGLSFAGMFGSIGEKADASKQSLDEYARSVQDLSNKELVAAVAKQENAVKDAKADVEKQARITKNIELEISYYNEAQKNLLTASQKADNEARAIESSRQLAIVKGNELDAEQKLDIARAILVGRIGEIKAAQDGLSKQSSELREKQAQLHAETERLRAGLDNGTTSYSDFYTAQMKEIEVAGRLSESDKKLMSTSRELISIEEQIQEQAKKNVDAYGLLAQGSEAYNKAVTSEADRIRERFQALSKLREEVIASEIATKKLRAETEAHTTVAKASNKALQDSANLLATEAEIREVASKVRQKELQLELETTLMLIQERDSIEKLIAQKQKEIELGTKKEQEVKKEIGALENQVTAKNAEIEARKKNIETLRLERIAAEVSGKTMQDAMGDLNFKIAAINRSLQDQVKAYNDALAAGKSQSELTSIYNNIVELERSLAEQSKERAIIMKQGWQSIGQSQEEAATGMDFQTRRMISAFIELAGRGELTSQQLTSSFTNALAKANTLEELEAIAAGLLNLEGKSKYSTDLIKQMMSDVAIKIAETAKAYDPVIQAELRYVESIQKIDGANSELAKSELELAQIREKRKEIAEANLVVEEKELKTLQDKRAEQLLELEAYRQAAERIATLIKNKDNLSDAEIAELAALQQKFPLMDQEIQKREINIKSIDKQIEKQELEVEQAAIMAGPIGALIRLYKDQTAEHERAAASNERYYDTQLKEIAGSIKVAKAKGDEAEAARLVAQQQDILISQAQAKAAAAQQDAIDAQRAIEAKTLEAAADGELTEAEKEQLAAMEDVAAAKQAAAQQSLDNADALREEARANKEAAAAAEQAAAAQQRAADDADRNARRMASVTSYAGEALDQLNAKGKAALDAIGKGYEHAGYTLQNMNRALAEEVRALDGAAQAEIAAADRLRKLQAAAEGVGPGADRAREALANLARGGGAGIRGITAAGEQAIATLEGIKAAAEQAAQSLADMAEDYRRQMLQLQGDQAGLLEAEHEDNLRRLKELHGAAGDYGNDEYNQAVARANQLHSLKLKQLREQEEEQRRRERDSASGATEDLDRLTEAAERTQQALSGLAGVSLSGLVGQARDIKGHFQGLNELL